MKLEWDYRGINCRPPAAPSDRSRQRQYAFPRTSFDFVLFGVYHHS